MIKKFIPSRIKIAFRNAVKKKYGFKEYEESYNDFHTDYFGKRKALERDIPKIDLEQKHINNLQVLLDRYHLLMQLPKNAVCAEIGVNEGDFSKQIIQVSEPAKLHLVDAWADAARYHDGLKLAVNDKFREEISIGKVEVNVGYSTDVLKTFPDNYFDWVYLDTDHTYKTTSAELNILKDKVKVNGIIAGHDYIIGNWVGDGRYGVIEAVHELCVNNQWELLFITINKDEMPSFAIRRIN